MKTRKMVRLGRRRNGQSLVEFAMMLPILLMVIFGVGGFAALFYAYLTMNLAVREGASSVVHNPRQTLSDVQTTILSRTATLDQSQIRIDISPSDPTQWLSGVSIGVTGFYTVNTPIAAYGPIRFQAQSIMTIE